MNRNAASRREKGERRMTQRKLLEVFLWMSLILFAMTRLVKAEGNQTAQQPQSGSEGLGATRAPMVDKVYQIIEATPPRFEIVVNIPATTLTLYDHGKPIRQHKVAVGSPAWPTPSGKYQIEKIEWNPWWYPPPSPWAKGAKPAPPGANNPLGPVKMAMGDALRIHGTNKPASVGYPQSHGCMRMLSAEAKSLAQFLQSEILGDKDPQIYEQYAKVAWQTFVKPLPEDEKVWVYLVYEPLERKSNEVVIYPNLYNRKIPYEDSLFQILAEAGILSAPIDLKKFDAIRKNAKGTLFIPFQDLLADGVDAKTLSPEFASICWNEAATNSIQAIRSRYNTHLQPVELAHTPPSEAARVSAR